ncbi:hypothetical protein [Actinomadura violacea]|uniref:Lipoprotein n=1 Tax=Actinomadura violacea TaxID=2819934 RepID=A0ABS3RQ34_9ACTN|nr:hypothetical protein [Actinomadura violacea]MBO2458848.1 hypothetical protein [Actinomadura violacea]
MRLSPRPAAMTAAALLLAGSLAGCSDSDGDAGNGSGKSAGAGAGAPTSAAAPKSTVNGANLDNATEALVKGTFDSPMAQGAKVDIAIMGLRVKGALATLTTRMTPHVPGGQRINAYRLNGEHGLGTSLIDPVNLKRYNIVKDSDGKSLGTDDIFTNMTNEQATPFYYTFAAPPENVKAIDVQIGSWPTFHDVPVQR